MPDARTLDEELLITRRIPFAIFIFILSILFIFFWVKTVEREGIKTVQIVCI